MGHSCNCSSTLVIAFASLLFMCTDSVKGLSWNQGLYICVSTYAVVCACVHVCVRQSVRLGMEGVSRGRVFLCTDKPLSWMNADVSGWLSACPLCWRPFTSFCHREKEPLSVLTKKPLNPRAPATSHPLSAEMALPTAALKKAGARDEPLCHSGTAQWAHIFTFSHTHMHTHIVFRHSKWESPASAKAMWMAVVNALCCMNTSLWDLFYLMRRALTGCWATVCNNEGAVNSTHFQSHLHFEWLWNEL